MADVFWNAEYNQILDGLVRPGDEKGRKVFETNRDVIKFAACLGWKKDRKEPRGANSLAIPMRIFESSKDQDLIWLIALMNARDVEILRKDEYHDREREAISIFEEYANGGLSLMSEWLSGLPTTDFQTTVIEKISSQFREEIKVADSPIEF